MCAKKSNQIVTIGVVIFLLLSNLLIISCGKDSKEHLTPLSFRLKWIVYSSFASHFVALEKGFFKDEGLDLTINPGGPGIDPIRLVVAGEDDVGLAGHEQILIAREQGIPVIAIGEDYVRSGVGFFSLKGSGIKEPKDFEGKKVATLPGTDKHTIYMALMAKMGVDRDKIEEMPVTFSLSLLLNRTVDVLPGFITDQPFVAEEQGIELNIIDPYEYGVRPGGNVYFTSAETLMKKRSKLKGFLRAVLQGIVVADTMPNDQVVDILLKYNNRLDRNAELKVWQASKTILHEHDPQKVGYMSNDKWLGTAEMAKEFGLINEIPPLEKCFTNELVDEIHKEGFPE